MSDCGLTPALLWKVLPPFLLCRNHDQVDVLTCGDTLRCRGLFNGNNFKYSLNSTALLTQYK
jgi:hypothetical protein